MSLTPRSSAPRPSTLYVGTVTRVDLGAGRADVEIPELARGYVYAQARIPDHYDPAATAGPTRPLAVGDDVLVGLLASNTGNRDTVVVVTRLA